MRNILGFPQRWRPRDITFVKCALVYCIFFFSMVDFKLQLTGNSWINNNKIQGLKQTIEQFIEKMLTTRGEHFFTKIILKVFLWDGSVTQNWNKNKCVNNLNAIPLLGPRFWFKGQYFTHILIILLILNTAGTFNIDLCVSASFFESYRKFFHNYI